jgi:hypothetical protein
VTGKYEERDITGIDELTDKDSLSHSANPATPFLLSPIITEEIGLCNAWIVSTVIAVYVCSQKTVSAP